MVVTCGSDRFFTWNSPADHRSRSCCSWRWQLRAAGAPTAPNIRATCRRSGGRWMRPWKPSPRPTARRSARRRSTRSPRSCALRPTTSKGSSRLTMPPSRRPGWSRACAASPLPSSSWPMTFARRSRTRRRASCSCRSRLTPTWKLRSRTSPPRRRRTSRRAIACSERAPAQRRDAGGGACQSRRTMLPPTIASRPSSNSTHAFVPPS
jgi:hypothetical protein